MILLLVNLQHSDNPEVVQNRPLQSCTLTSIILPRPVDAQEIA